MSEVEGRKLAQSGAILRYLANKFGLAGKNDLEKAKVDEVYNFYTEVYLELAPYLYIKRGRREGDLVSYNLSINGSWVAFKLKNAIITKNCSG
jgi:glutathione S-transferase